MLLNKNSMIIHGCRSIYSCFAAILTVGYLFFWSFSDIARLSLLLLLLSTLPSSLDVVVLFFLSVNKYLDSFCHCLDTLRLCLFIF